MISNLSKGEPNTALPSDERTSSELSTRNFVPAKAWADDSALFNCYQQLEFFDTLSLYFCLGDPAAPRQAIFHRVPLAVGADVTITIRPLRPGFYGLAPYPFAEDFLEVSVTGRYTLPVPPPADLTHALAGIPEDVQKFTLVDASADV